jgi:phage baseplate assembly protein gpV
MSAGGGYGIISPLSVGNQVKVIFSHGDADFPVIVGRVLSTVDPVPMSPATGGYAKPGELLIATPGGAFMHFQDNGQVAGGGAKFTWTGDVEFDGNVTVTKTLTAQQDVLAGPASVSAVNHTHPDVQTGDGNTGKPQG